MRPISARHPRITGVARCGQPIQCSPLRPQARPALSPYDGQQPDLCNSHTGSDRHRHSDRYVPDQRVSLTRPDRHRGNITVAAMGYPHPARAVDQTGTANARGQAGHWLWDSRRPATVNLGVSVQSLLRLRLFSGSVAITVFAPSPTSTNSAVHWPKPTSCGLHRNPHSFVQWVMTRSLPESRFPAHSCTGQ